MQIKVRVIPNSSIPMVQTELDGSLRVKLTAPPVKNKANEQLIEFLAKHYNVKRSAVRLLKGAASKDKIVEVKV